MPDLEVAGLVKTYEARSVLCGLELHADRGQSVALVGPSGCGKSTLLQLVGLLDAPDSGRMALDGKVYSELPESQWPGFRHSHTGFVFQDHLLLPELTCLQNVLVPVLGRCTESHVARAKELMGTLGLSARIDAYPWQMSGGERQRAAIARALLLKPDLLLCDEPTGNLDAETGRQVMQMLLENGTAQAGIVLVATHNLEHAKLCSRVFRFTDGRLALLES